MNEPMKMLAELDRRGGVSVLSAAETDLEVRERQTRDALQADITKRNGFFVVNTPGRPKGGDEDEE